MAVKKSFWTYGEFRILCEKMGYRPEQVISIRILRDSMFITFEDTSSPVDRSTGKHPLRTQGHEVK